MQLLRGLIAGGVRNPVLVNLLTICILVGGAFSAHRMVRESYPEFALDHIVIEVAYPGASPEDVERAICTPIEEVLHGLRGVRTISSSSNANFGTVWVGLLGNVDNPGAIVEDIKDRIEQITNFPPEAKRPIVREAFIRAEVINIAIFGDVPEHTLKALARQVRDDLSAIPGISQISLSGVRDDEIIIEISEQALSAYNLSIAEVMEVVARNSLDLPSGVIRTAEEELTLRVTGQLYLASDYENLVVLQRGGAVVHLGDIATVREGFEEAVARGRFNGQSAAVVHIYKTPDEDATRIAATVRDYVASRQLGLPDRLRMSVWADGSGEIDSRINMLARNGLMGIVLVFATLTLFLEFRVAFWVVVGIPVSFAGALIIMGVAGATLNLVSLFALILVCGIIVDDAIVIADNIHTRRRAGEEPALASINGACEMALPVLGASLTTIAAFVPLLFVVGVMGRFIHILPIVVIAAICASALEAFGVLPLHLCERHPPGIVVEPRSDNRVRRKVDALVETVITRWYRPACRAALGQRFITVSIAAALLLVAVGAVLGGRAPMVLFPQEDGNILQARVRFPEGTPVSVTDAAIRQVERAAMKLNEDPLLRPATDGPLVRQAYSILGEFADFLPVRGNNLCETRIELMPAEDRRVRDGLIMERWRHHIGKLYDATHFRIAIHRVGPLDRPIEVRLLGNNLEQMSEASQRIQDKLREFEGVGNVADDLIPGKRELRVTLRPSARMLGLTLDDLATQLRLGFFGGEGVRLRRGRDEVIVRVRYPDDERRSVIDLENLRVTTPRGDKIPFLQAAEIEWARGYANIMHQGAKRRVRILADVDDRVANAERIVQTLQTGFLDDVVGDYNDLRWEFGGDRERMDESMASMWDGLLLAMIAIYAILASMLRSYVQPIVILVVVPFGVIGAVAGHTILGLDLTLLSLFGIVALSGVVVNDSLVLVDVINSGIRDGKSVREAVLHAGERRFRAVVVTSITTVAGLLPLLLERSSQAQTVIPMAVSLSFGLMFATVLTLFVVPALYLIVNDGRRTARWLRYGGAFPAPELVEEAAEDRRRSAGSESQ